MALRGSRPIVVNDIRFRWVFSGKKDRWGNSPRVAHVAVQEDTPSGKPGRAMVAWLTSRKWISHEAHDMDSGGLPHKAHVTPADVRRIIEKALQEGWNPSSRTHHEVSPGLALSGYETCVKP
jgi:hypothetical protein